MYLKKCIDLKGQPPCLKKLVKQEIHLLLRPLVYFRKVWTHLSFDKLFIFHDTASFSATYRPICTFVFTQY